MFYLSNSLGNEIQLLSHEGRILILLRNFSGYQRFLNRISLTVFGCEAQGPCCEEGYSSHR